MSKTGANPKVPQGCVPIDPSAGVSLWECPQSGHGKVWFSQASAAEVGTPICGECDNDMVLSKNKEELTADELLIAISLATFAMADSEVFDATAREHRIKDTKMKEFQEKLNRIRDSLLE